jgi:hypothetical protein
VAHELGEDLDTFGGRKLAPDAGVIGRPRRPDGRLDLVDRRAGNLGDDLLGAGVLDGEDLPGAADVLAVDEL